MTQEVTDSTFEQEVTQSELPVVVDFWAPWCGPCKMMAPKFEELSQESGDRFKFVKINVDETEIAQRFGVRGIPAFAVFKQGQFVGMKTGAMTKEALLTFVESRL